MKTLTALLLLLTASTMSATTIIEQWDAGFAPGEDILQIVSLNGDTNDNGPAFYCCGPGSWISDGIIPVLEQEEIQNVIASFQFQACPSNADCILEDTVSTTVGWGPPATPEPGTFVLIGGGLVAMGFVRRRVKA